MAGLAVGSYVSGRIVDRITRRSALLALYGGMEISIGICAMLVPFHDPGGSADLPIRL